MWAVWRLMRHLSPSLARSPFHTNLSTAEQGSAELRPCVFPRLLSPCFAHCKDYIQWPPSPEGHLSLSLPLGFTCAVIKKKHVLIVHKERPPLHWLRCRRHIKEWVHVSVMECCIYGFMSELMCPCERIESQCSKAAGSYRPSRGMYCF